MPVILGLLIAFILIAVFSNRRTRGCRWRAYPNERMWRCAMCGAAQAGDPRRAPQICARQIPNEPT